MLPSVAAGRQAGWLAGQQIKCIVLHTAKFRDFRIIPSTTKVWSG